MHMQALFAFALAPFLSSAQKIPHYDDWRAHAKPNSCGSTCSDALTYPTFSDVTGTDYYKLLCTSKLRTESIYQCIDAYCRDDEIGPGVEAYKETCTVYSPFTPLPYDAFDHSMSRGELYRKAVAQEELWVNVTGSGQLVNSTIIPYPAFFEIEFKTVATFDWNIDLSVMYGWAMYVFWGCVLGISLATKIFSWLTRSTSSKDLEQIGASQSSGGFISKLRVKINYLLLTPATIGKRSVEPYGWCTVPPLIETLTIFAFIAINIVVNAVNFEAFIGNTYYPASSLQIWRYIGDRSGIVSFANLPILWLFGQRNNVLSWLVGWTPTTYNNFHRWVARVATLEAVIHSIAWTAWSFEYGAENYYTTWKEQYWYMGGVATVCMSLMIGFSVYSLRARAYEVFLYIHIALAIVTLIGCFFHVKVYATHEYDGYLWACTAIWVLDRLLRIVRLIVLNAFRSKSAVAHYSEGSHLMRLEVPVNPVVARAKGSFYFVYVLHSWSFFQSHPFTASYAVSTPQRKLSTLVEGDLPKVVDTADIKEVKGADVGVTDSTSSRSSDIVSPEPDNFHIDYSTLRFFMRPFSGATRQLRDRLVSTQGNSTTNVRVLIEGPYSIQDSLHHFENVLFVVGGSGITVTLQYLQTLVARKRAGGHVPFVHVLWAVRQPDLLHDFNDEMHAYRRALDARITLHTTAERRYPSIAQDVTEKPSAQDGITVAGWAAVSTGRPDIYEYVENERRARQGSLVVVSCSPPAMADDTRQAVVSAMRSTQMDIQLLQESFTW